jgi:hypothetical protein
MKQFFAFSKEHQTLSRSRLRRFLMLSATRFDYKKFDSRFAFAQDDTQTLPHTADRNCCAVNKSPRQHPPHFSTKKQ